MDEPLSWPDRIVDWEHAEELTVQEEFDWLRHNPKWSGAQARRVKHLEEHLERGDIVCNCYREGD